MNLRLGFLLSLTLFALIMPAACAQLPILVWKHSVYDSDTLDIAVSKDGQYVAAVGKWWDDDIGNTIGQIRYYSRESGTPLWTWITNMTVEKEKFFSVAISADGDSVVAGGEMHVFYWKNARSLSGTPDPTWEGEDVVIYSPVQRCLDISDDGNYVVFCGPRDVLGIIYYYADAKTKTEKTVPPTWTYNISSSSTDNFFRAVDLSSDGDYVAAGFGSNVGYWKNARTLTGNPQNPDWTSTRPNDLVVDVAVSDDGEYVAAAAMSDGVHYWSGANDLSGDPSSTWQSNGETGVNPPPIDFSAQSIDMSSDGDSVVAGNPEAWVYFWDGARSLIETSPPTWSTRTTAAPEAQIEDVEMNDRGTYMVVVDSVPYEDLDFQFTIYFFDRVGALIWEYPFPKDWYTVSISLSGDGRSLAAGTSMPFSSYLFDTLATTTASSTVTTTVIQSISTVYSTMYSLSTVPTTTSTSTTMSTTTVGGTITEYVTQIDTVYAYLLTILEYLQAAVPEYPVGLASLAIFMIAAYGLIRRRTVAKKRASEN